MAETKELLTDIFNKDHLSMSRIYGARCETFYQSCFPINGELLLRNAPAGHHGSRSYHRGLDICLHENSYHDSLQACLIIKCACSESW